MLLNQLGTLVTLPINDPPPPTHKEKNDPVNKHPEFVVTVE